MVFGATNTPNGRDWPIMSFDYIWFMQNMKFTVAIWKLNLLIYGHKFKDKKF